MNSNLTKICYRGETGESDLRTLILGEILYISLRDVLITQNKENREINADYTVKSMAGIIRAQLQALAPDEYITTDAEMVFLKVRKRSSSPNQVCIELCRVTEARLVSAFKNGYSMRSYHR